MKINHFAEEYAIYGMLFSLSNRIQTIGDKEFCDITMKQHFLMVALELFKEPPTLKQMGELIGCCYQNVKRMENQLEKNGYQVNGLNEEDIMGGNLGDKLTQKAKIIADSFSSKKFELMCEISNIEICNNRIVIQE